ncbi:MAG: hypothetical protein NKF70_03285 [Methanobacterium sp. ERen5]|nr:MAG: hypothetical protein NKF70_03285 [Methanobacterium sp. ERen5]
MEKQEKFTPANFVEVWFVKSVITHRRGSADPATKETYPILKPLNNVLQYLLRATDVI